MRCRCVTATVVVLVVVMALVHLPATGQEPTTVPQTSTPSGRPAGDDLDGEGGSPRIFALLSVLGGATAVTILAVQWVRTRPPGPR
ncbi:MAG TPA: hypothetical protein VGR26_17630 [Acidimicrobiales bacterium]|nr:hypothetical protein [Acidimicrobiales bacterium]